MHVCVQISVYTQRKVHGCFLTSKLILFCFIMFKMTFFAQLKMIKPSENSYETSLML